MGCDCLMLRCAWCRKKIKDNQPVFGLSVMFAENVDFSNVEGTFTQIKLNSRNTSVPMIVTTSNSDAKIQGTDGIFPICSEKCGGRMKDALKEELSFKEFKDKLKETILDCVVSFPNVMLFLRSGP